MLQIWEERCSIKSLRFDFGPRLGEIQGLVYDIGRLIELPHDSFPNMKHENTTYYPLGAVIFFEMG